MLGVPLQVLGGRLEEAIVVRMQAACRAIIRCSLADMQFGLSDLQQSLKQMKAVRVTTLHRPEAVRYGPSTPGHLGECESCQAASKDLDGIGVHSLYSAIDLHFCLRLEEIWSFRLQSRTSIGQWCSVIPVLGVSWTGLAWMPVLAKYWSTR